MYAGIREVLQGFLSRTDASGGANEQELVQQLISQMNTGTIVPTQISGAADRAKTRYLHVRVNAGKAFLDCLVDPSAESRSPTSAVTSAVFFTLKFKGKRVRFPALEKKLPTSCLCPVNYNCLPCRSKAVMSTVEPAFDEDWLFPLQDEAVSDAMASLPSLLQISEPIEIAVYQETRVGAGANKRDDDKGERMVELMGTHKLEWRKVLVHGKAAIAVEIKGENGNGSAVFYELDICSSVWLLIYFQCQIFLLGYWTLSCRFYR